MKKKIWSKKVMAWSLAFAMVMSVVPSSKLTMSVNAQGEDGIQVEETLEPENQEEAILEAPGAEEKSIGVSVAAPNGDIVAGTVLTAQVSLSGGEPVGNYNYVYKWYRVSEGAEDEQIEGATAASYTVTDSDARKKLKVVVTSDYCSGEFFAVTTGKVKVQGTVKISESSPRTKFWDGKPFVPEVELGGNFTDADKEKVSFLYYTYGPGTPLGQGENAPTDIGTYYVQAVVEGDDVVRATSSWVTVTIKWANTNDLMKVTSDYQPGKTYDGTPMATPTADQIQVGDGIDKEAITYVWYEGDTSNLVDENYNWNGSINEVKEPTNAGTYTLVGYISQKAKVVLGTYTIERASGTKDPNYFYPSLTGFCGDMLGLISFPEKGWNWYPTNPDLVLKCGSTVKVKGIYLPEDMDNYTAVTRSVTVKIEHDFESIQKVPYKAATATKAGNYTYYKCSVCNKYYNKYKKQIPANSWIIPVIPSNKGVVMGKVVDVSQIIQDGSKAFVRMSVNSKYKNYITVSGRKLKLCSEFKKGMPNTIPVSIVMRNCERTSGLQYYTVNLKVMPDITITKTAIAGGTKYKYAFTYNFVGATKVQVRLKEGGNDDANRLLDARVSGITSNENSYLTVADWKLNELGGKITFIITVYYDGKTITRTITK